MITVFSNFSNTKNAKYYEIDTILAGIKNGKIQSQLDEIRNEKDEKKKKDLKKMLPCILFSGKFSERADKKIIEHSGFCVLDFDKVENVNEKKAEIMTFPFVYAAFISPSGAGVKAVVKIPPIIEKHRGHYKALANIFPDCDSTSINESRICYGSLDKDILINKNAIEFTEYIEDINDININRSAEFKQVSYNDYAKANRALKIIRDSVDGEKHIELLKASKLMGGYISGGIISEYEAIRLLENEIQNKKIDDFDSAKTTIRAGIKYGKEAPIEQIEYETIKSNIKPIIKNSGIKKIDDVWEQMKYGFHNGKARGTSTYFPNFDLNFTWKKGEITLIIGKGNSGKTEFILQLMLIKSIKEGVKWGVFSPENYPADEFYDSLIHSYVGKTTDPHYKNFQMSFKEYENAYEFIKRFFYYVYPDETHTIEEIEANFSYLIEHEKIHGVLLDPYNQIISDMEGKRDDQFLSVFLTQRKKYTIKNDIYFLICTHPRSMQRNKQGEYDVPDVYDIAGGAMWSNKADNIMSVHRPNYISDPKDTTVEIHVKKIKKQKLVGIPGVCQFDFDRFKNRYYQNGFSPIDNSKYVKSESSQKSLQPINKKRAELVENNIDEPDPF